MECPMARADEVISDEKTLRLAAPPLTEATISALIRFQRALLEEVQASPGEEGLARAHARAVEACGLESVKVAQVAAAAAAFCTVRWQARELTRRRALALERIEAARAQGVGAPAREFAVVERIDRELSRVEDLGPLERRYGGEGVARLEAREDELLELHRALSRVYGGRG